MRSCAQPKHVRAEGVVMLGARPSFASSVSLKAVVAFILLN